jgi:hypothetical protein
MSDDLLDAVKAFVETSRAAGTLTSCVYAKNGTNTRLLSHAEIAGLVSEVERLRQRHAEAVEAAWREGFNCWPLHGSDGQAAWLASEARKGLT